MTELVTVTVDGREIRVPKGTGMVETALAAGIEIPVFCYEPRLGPPVGACRMCLCEVEGMPKLQAACTMTAQDEMVLRTAQTSEKAAHGQDAVLEFILLNHPLDCPDCDKGGECPLQDLTFRWGPGKTRMVISEADLRQAHPDLPDDHARPGALHPLLPLHALLRGHLGGWPARGEEPRCELADRDLRGRALPGALLRERDELCPVGALLPTTYRFKARPWEIDNVPTVCGLCPVGCNTWVTVREGKAQRVLSRNHPEVDDGWLCDKGRFTFGHLRAGDRIREPLLRVRRRGFDQVTIEQALDEAERGLREAAGSVVVAFSGGESVEHATALARLVREGLGASAVGLIPDDLDPVLDGFRAPLSAIRDSEVCLVVGDDPVVERAPVVDLWLKAARRQGAEVILAGPTGQVHVAPGGAGAFCASPPPEVAERLQARGERRHRVVAGRA